MITLAGPDSGSGSGRSLPHASALGRLPQAVLDHVIATVLHLAPSTIASLLCSTKQIHLSVVRSLYKEVYVCDDVAAIEMPPFKTRLESVLSNPVRYGSLVRTLVIVPAITPQHACQHTDIPVQRGRLQPDQLNRLLSKLGSLTSIVW